MCLVTQLGQQRTRQQPKRVCVPPSCWIGWIQRCCLTITFQPFRALEEHLQWETRAKTCRDLLSDMLKSRLEATELTKQGYDLRPQPTKRDLLGAWWQLQYAKQVLGGAC